MGHNRIRPYRIFLAFCAVLATATLAFGAVTEHVSVDSAGTLANSASTFSAVSADGRFVAFASGASNLVPGDANGAFDVFVRDRANGTTERVSVDSAGGEANGMSIAPAISGDGQVVAFVSAATNLVAGDTNGHLDVFVHDRVSGATSRASVDTNGLEASADSVSPWLSNDGGRLVFASLAGDLVPGDTNSTFDVFVRDRVALVTLRVSVDSLGGEANGASLAPRLSSDGLVVVFHSGASNLVAGDVNFSSDVFVHDLSTGTTEMASVDSSGIQGNFQSVAGTVSADGRFVAFDSDATNLVAGDSNFRTDVFVHDRQTGTTERVSVGPGGVEGNRQSGFVNPPSISAEGRFVAFASDATNLVANDSNNFVDMFRHDRMSGETTRVSVSSDGTEGDAPTAHWPSLSADGSVVIFASGATNLVPGDTNGVQDVFAHGSSCGNGTVDEGEQCDDGNADDSDCCTSACTMAPVGTSCDDGDSCTSGDFCAEGVCLSGEIDPEACLDAMRCYGARPSGGHRPLKPGEFTLADPLQEGAVEVGGARNMCVPVDLDGVDASEDGPGLACHQIQKSHGFDSLGGGEVTISNRLGVQTLAVYRPRWLCLASGFEEPPVPGTLDHFTCYGAQAIEKRELRRFQAVHKDPFGSFESKVSGVVALCTATGVNGAAVSHPQAHLVCYRARDQYHRTDMDVFESRRTTVYHAFGKETLDLLRHHPKRVCVPSQILEGGPPPGPMG